MGSWRFPWGEATLAKTIPSHNSDQPSQKPARQGQALRLRDAPKARGLVTFAPTQAIPACLTEPRRASAMFKGLEGKSAIVTGGSTLIGAGVVRALLAAGAMFVSA
jgi:hypothetical protein